MSQYYVMMLKLTEANNEPDISEGRAGDSFDFLFESLATAEVTRVEITAKRDFAAGRAFGSVGPYERLSGKIYFAVDPGNRKQRDPVTGVEEGIPENSRAGKVQPRIFYTFTDTEYWESGGGLAHATPDSRSYPTNFHSSWV